MLTFEKILKLLLKKPILWLLRNLLSLFNNDPYLFCTLLPWIQHLGIFFTQVSVLLLEFIILSLYLSVLFLLFLNSLRVLWLGLLWTDRLFFGLFFLLAIVSLVNSRLLLLLNFDGAWFDGVNYFLSFCHDSLILLLLMMCSLYRCVLLFN